jgi:hypothetical protein
MSDLTIFIVGLVVTLIAGMGVMTSQVFVAYQRKPKNYVVSESIQNI